MNVGNVGNTNWWATGSGRNPGIHRWQPRSVREGGSLFGANQSGTSQAARNSVVQLRETSEALTRALNTIRGIGNTNSPMQANRPVSGNTDALAIRSFDSNRLRGSGAADFNVEIVQLAQAQRHDGAALNSSARATESGFTAGAHHIAITVGDRQFDIHFNVSANDTNRDVQQRIASAINNRSDIAVTASVNLNAEAGTSALVLQSSQTGINANTPAGQPNFTVSSLVGNAVSAAGVENISQHAQNAQFRVNRGFTGALQTSRANDVDLGFGIMAELREVGTVEVEMGRDIIAQQNAFRHMVNSFNNLVEAARSAGNGSALASELGGIGRSFSSQLERIGISLNSEGRMQIDEARMAAAAESGELERFATRDGFNFMSRLTRASEGVSRNPAVHVQQETAVGGAGGFDPANFMNAGINFTPMQSASMARFMNLGVLFDSLF
ncbi:MAG: hypothetical protein FWB91_10965 [Defluviitaleaceae bacterium]|nr:hypothetical protein [Defluviitaleaceae bacterium]